MLLLFSIAEFEHAVREHKVERHARSFTCWNQFVALVSKTAFLPQTRC
jgi:hypothetical protein